MEVTTSIIGTEQILSKMKALPDKLAKRAMRRALRKGANVIRDIARSNAKAVDDVLTREAIWENISTQGGGARRERREGGPTMRVGVLGGAREKSGDSAAPGGDTFYWRFLEFGTSQMQARPFMRPAIASGAEKAIQTTIDAMQKEVAKELAKMGVK